MGLDSSCPYKPYGGGEGGRRYFPSVHLQGPRLESRCRPQATLPRQLKQVLCPNFFSGKRDTT